MVKISPVNYYNSSYIPAKNINKQSAVTSPLEYSSFENYAPVTAENLKAYSPSFTAVNFKKNVKKTATQPSLAQQLKTIKSQLDKASIARLNSLDKKGILMDKNSNDGSSVLENLYNIATKERITGLSSSQIMAETIKALDNPFTITQKFGDIPDNVADEISKETGTEFPQKAKNVVSSSCVVASMEFNLASKKPAEFVRFVEGLSGASYSVDKRVKMTDISQGTADCLWKLRKFNTDSYLENNWQNAVIKVKPDRNAIVRARVQSSYKDPGERSCVDVLIQSALLNLGSQHTYDSITDERTGEFNSDNTGLTDFEKTFVENIVFESSKIPVVYQQIDENGHLSGYNAKPEEVKQHILKSLELGQNVIIGYTHLDNNNDTNGGHEITIIGYKQGSDGKNYFICNDTDDNVDAPVEIEESKLIPLIHHAGILESALSSEDVVTEHWKDVFEQVKPMIKD